jgi:hypothetical protein
MVAAIVLNPTHAKVGTSVLITGSGFADTSAITFTYDGSAIVPTDAPITSDGSGGFTAHITIPAGVEGVHPVVATDASLGTATANFTVDSFISISPSTQRIGGSTTVTGTGFATVSAVTITIGGTTVTGVTTDATGGFIQAETVPTLASGSQTVSATDAGTNNATDTLTVSAPTLTRSPTHGPKGTVVTLTGANYIPSHSLTITNVDSTTSNVTSDSSGNIPASTTIPTGPNVQGSHNITVSDGTNTGTVAFTTDTSISLSPSSAKVGDTVTITGEGYANASAVSSTFAGSSVTTSPSAPSPSSAGHWTATFVIPAALHGSNTVSCTDVATNNATATETVNSSISLSPTHGRSGEVITVTGTGYGNTQSVTATFAGSSVSFITSVTTNSSGGFSGSLIAPVTSVGVKTIVATDALTNTASSSFTADAYGTMVPLRINGNSPYLSSDNFDQSVAVTSDAYVDYAVIDFSGYSRGTFQLYCPDLNNDVTYQILGHENPNGLIEAPASNDPSWASVSTGDITHQAASTIVSVTNRYHWILIQAKRKSSGQNTILQMWTKGHFIP